MRVDETSKDIEHLFNEFPRSQWGGKWRNNENWMDGWMNQQTSSWVFSYKECTFMLLKIEPLCGVSKEMRLFSFPFLIFSQELYLFAHMNW